MEVFTSFIGLSVSTISFEVQISFLVSDSLDMQIGPSATVRNNKSQRRVSARHDICTGIVIVTT